MRVPIRTFAYLLVLIQFSALPVAAEYLFLTDGSIIKGKVVIETSAEVVFSHEQKKENRYPRVQVIRVLYTELNMGRIYVQKKNGEALRVYMVDEDRENYTFRNELNKPKEFKVGRADVLFIAERNPSALKGEPGDSAILLEWYPPYDKMKYFNIYIKKKKGDQYYSVAGTTAKNSYLLKDLESSTVYFIKVTGVDDAGTETSPSNELQISTLDSSAAGNEKIENYRETLPYGGNNNIFRLYFTPSVIYPVSVFGDMGGTGYGGTLSFTGSGFFADGITAGFETGYFYIPGKDSPGFDGNKVNRFQMIPLNLKAGYRLASYGGFSVTPVVLLGAVYIDLTYLPGADLEKTSTGIDPHLNLNLMFDYALSDSFFAGLTGGCGFLFEKERTLRYFQAGINFGVGF